MRKDKMKQLVTTGVTDRKSSRGRPRDKISENGTMASHCKLWYIHWRQQQNKKKCGGPWLTRLPSVALDDDDDIFRSLIKLIDKGEKRQKKNLSSDGHLVLAVRTNFNSFTFLYIFVGEGTESRLGDVQSGDYRQVEWTKCYSGWYWRVAWKKPSSPF